MCGNIEKGAAFTFETAPFFKRTVAFKIYCFSFSPKG